MISLGPQLWQMKPPIKSFYSLANIYLAEEYFPNYRIVRYNPSDKAKGSLNHGFVTIPEIDFLELEGEFIP